MKQEKTNTPDNKLPKYQQPEAVRLGSQPSRGYAATCTPGSSADGACITGGGNTGGTCNTGAHV